MNGRICEELIGKIKEIKILILDVDGVLTDGRIFIDDSGNELKGFNVRDGHGIKLVIRGGIEVIFLTGRKSRVVEHRARDLGVEEVYQKALNKKEVLDQILKEKKVSAVTVAYIGDDIVDIPVLKKAGFSVAVADAHEDVKKIVDYITRMKGGEGAVREICEIILKVQGTWDGLVDRYDL
jgi:3-deoxy-D-manno-octulosonate 8-phosphate phosphatase (KDO 8-P phosphatase)